LGPRLARERRRPSGSDIRASRGQRDRHRLTQALTGAGDERDATIESKTIQNHGLALDVYEDF
jgi:hypothetical protein